MNYKVYLEHIACMGAENVNTQKQNLTRSFVTRYI